MVLEIHLAYCVNTPIGIKALVRRYSSIHHLSAIAGWFKIIYVYNSTCQLSLHRLLCTQTLLEISYRLLQNLTCTPHSPQFLHITQIHWLPTSEPCRVVAGVLGVDRYEY